MTIGERMFLSTPPSRVATLEMCGLAAEDYASFYPRHPRGWRRTTGLITQDGQNVSIHATLGGGDDHSAQYKKIIERFYPRHPRGWRQ